MEKFTGTTLKEWKEYLKRNKEDEYKKWKKENNIQSIPRRSIADPKLPEGELR